LLGAALGGVIIGALEAPAVMLMNGASFLLSGLLMTLFPYVIATVSGAVSAVGTGAISGGSSSPAIRVTSYIYAISGLLREFAEGLRYIAGMSKLHRFIGAQLFIFTVLYTCNTLLPVFTTRVLALGAQALGFIDAAWAGGAILGGFLLTTFALFKVVRLLPVFILALCLGIGGFAVSGSLYQAASAYFLMGLLATGARIMTDTELQKATDPQYMGRVAGTIQSMTSYIGLIIYLSVSYLADTVDIRMIYCALACLGGVGLLVAYAVSLGFCRKFAFSRGLASVSR
jgi:MFS transporter, DHA3 family, macrolide efflux protein